VPRNLDIQREMGLVPTGQGGSPAPASTDYPYVMEEATTISQIDGNSGLAYSAIYVDANLGVTYSGATTVVTLSGESSTGDNYILGIGYDLNLIYFYSYYLGCTSGYEEMWLAVDNAGDADYGACETGISFAAGETVTLGLYYASADVEFYACNGSSCVTYASAQPDGTSTDFIVSSTSPSTALSYTGTMTWLMDPNAGACTKYSGLEKVDYDFHQGVYVSEYLPWSRSWYTDATGYNCYVYSPAVLTESPGAPVTTYTESTGGSSYGPHWVAGQNLALSGSYWWRFQTDVNPLAIPTLTSDRSTADVGQPVTLTASASGGISPYTYPWYLNGASQGATSSPWTWTPSAASPTPYSIDTYVLDSDYDENGLSGVVSITVSSDPAVAVPTAAPGSGGIDLGQSVTFTSATPTGGLSPFTYSWTSYPAGCTNTLASTLPCTPTASGSSSVVVMVTDANGMSATSPTLSYTVDTAVAATLSIAPTVIDLGQTANLTVTPSGGAGGYAYSYSNLPTGCLSSNTNPLPCKPTSSGSYASITATVTDANSGSVTTSGVSLTVNSKLLLGTFTASPPAIVEGGTTYLNVTVSGGTVPYSYAYTVLPTGCTTSNVASLACKPTANGTFPATVVVTDAAGMTVTATLNVTVVSPLAISSFTASPSTFVEGGTTNLTVKATGGFTPYSYAYTGLPTGCSSSNVSILTCHAGANGTFTINVTVTDHSKTSVKQSLKLTIIPPLVLTSFVADPSLISLGNSTTFTAKATGGLAPYSYAYTNLPTGCTSSNTSALLCKPTAIGTTTVTVKIADRMASSVSKTATLTVKNTISVLAISSFIASPSPVTLDSRTNITVVANGGTLPYYYAYTGLPAGCSTQNISLLPCTPTVKGNFTVWVWVNDSGGQAASKYTTLQVVSTNPSVPVITNMYADPNPVEENSETQINVVVIGGATPYAFSYAGLPPSPECANQNLNPLPCTPTSPGNYTIVVTVTDRNSNSATRSLLLVVEGGVLPLAVTLSSNVTTTSIDSPVLLTATITGGSAPYYYTWSVNGTNVSLSQISNTWTRSFAYGGNYALKVWVKDSTGAIAGSKVVSLSVSGVGHSSGVGPSSPFPWWVVLLVLVAVVVLILLFVVMKRNRARQELAGDMAQGTAPAAGGEVGVAYPLEPAPAEGVPVDYSAEGGFATGGMAAETGQAGEIYAAQPESPAPEGDQYGAPETAGETVSFPLPTAGTPPPPPPGEAPPLTQCPQCQSNLTDEGLCMICGVVWVPDMDASQPQPTEEYQDVSPFGGPEWAPRCQRCNIPVGADLICPSCGSQVAPPPSPPSGEEPAPSTEQAAEAPPPKERPEVVITQMSPPEMKDQVEVGPVTAEDTEVGEIAAELVAADKSQKAAEPEVAPKEEEPAAEAGEEKPGVVITQMSPPEVKDQVEVGPVTAEDTAVGEIATELVAAQKSKKKEEQEETPRLEEPVAKSGEEKPAVVITQMSPPEVKSAVDVGPVTAEDTRVGEIATELVAAQASQKGKKKRKTETKGQEEVQKPSGEAVKAETPASTKKTCFICGSELEGDFCKVCNMHWDSAT
jgi:hypothetical protein